MGNKVIILISCGLLYGLSLFSQCDSRDSARKKLHNLKEASSLSPAEKLTALLQHESVIRRCGYADDSTYVLLLELIGKTYAARSDFLKAAAYYSKGIQFIGRHAVSSAVDPTRLIQLYYVIADFYDSLNNVTAKMAALDSCATIAMRLKLINIPCLWSLYARIEYFYDIGDYRRCIDYAILCHRLGLEFQARGTGIPYQYGAWYASSSLHWHVNALLALKNYEAAEQLLLSESSGNEGKTSINNLTALYEQLAEIQLHRKNYAKALVYFDKAFKEAKKQGNAGYCNTILNNIGFYIYNNYYNDPDKAIEYYRRGLRVGANTSHPNRMDSIESINTLNSLAGAYVRKGSFDSADRYFRLAFDYIKKGIQVEDLLSIPLDEFDRQKKLNYITNLVIAKADAGLHRYKHSRQPEHITAAIRIYRYADQLLDRLKSRQFDLQSKLFWRSDSRLLYERAIEACYVAGDMTSAFYFFEKSRAILLNDQLNEQRWLGEVDIQKQTQLKKKILQLEQQYNTMSKFSPGFAEVQKELFDSKRESDRLINTIRNTNPLYYQNYIDTTSITIGEVRKKIFPAYNGLVEIFSGDSAAYSFIIAPGKLILNKINRVEFDSLSGMYSRYISDMALQNKNFRHFADISSKLYQLIFAGTSLPPGRMIISSNANYFPFEALLINGPGELPRYFLQQYSATYTFSARYLLRAGNATVSNPSRQFFGLAPVSYNAGMKLPQLPGSDISLRKIDGYFQPATILTASGATRNSFLQSFSDYRFIHLYTHAADNSSRDEPVIYFADSALYLSELASSRKPVAGLIVLSACETGTGKFYQGEGVFSFARGFASLGIPSSISNMWSVDNESTYKITESFYKYLAEGLPADMALQKAKLEFFNSSGKEHKLPYYWAASVLIGTSDAVQAKAAGGGNKFAWIFISVAIVAIMTILFLFGKKFFSVPRRTNNQISKKPGYE